MPLPPVGASSVPIHPDMQETLPFDVVEEPDFNMTMPPVVAEEPEIPKEEVKEEVPAIQKEKVE